MHGKITIGIVLLSLTLIATACAGSSSPVALLSNPRNLLSRSLHRTR